MVRTVKNVLADGSMFLFPDPSGSHLIWELSYSELSEVDVQSLSAHFNACAGPLRAFTFIDPTDNILVSSTDLMASAWQTSPLFRTTSGITDPEGENGAFTITNNGQTPQELSQQLAIPSNYRYCLSAYVRSSQPAAVTLVRRGSVAEQSQQYSVGPNWSRIVLSGRLDDPGTEIAIALSVPAGKQIDAYGIQLEAHVAPSQYRRTTARGGVYANAHWSVEEFPVIAEAPGLFSTAFTIETAL
jgi:hypothetical protein